MHTLLGCKTPIFTPCCKHISVEPLADTLLSRTYTQRPAHDLLTTCSRSTHDLFTSCPRNSRLAHELLTIYSRIVHDLLTICSRYAHDLLTICSQYAHELLMICSRYAHDLLTDVHRPCAMPAEEHLSTSIPLPPLSARDTVWAAR